MGLTTVYLETSRSLFLQGSEILKAENLMLVKKMGPVIWVIND